MLTLETLRATLSYNQATGLFTRKIKSNLAAVGSIAGYIDSSGYRCIAVGGRPYKAHRLAWFYITGSMPQDGQFIDHINGKKADNRFCNLRLATNSQNQANRGPNRASSSHVKGVSWQPSRKKWIAMITVDGVVSNLGRFYEKSDAIVAYKAAAIAAFGNFAHGVDINSPQKTDLVGDGIIYHPDITQKILHEIFHYDPDTGWFTRKINRQGRAKTGDRAGNLEWTGYRRLKVQGRSYREHHLVWLYVHGFMPKDEIDHINGNPSDNRIANLRECGSTQNKWNRRVQNRAKTGKKGVTYDGRQIRKYIAKIKVDNKRVVLGNFLTLDEASTAYDAAARETQGEFAHIKE